MAQATALQGYKITLPALQRYGFRAEARGFVSVNDYLDTSSVSNYTEIVRDLRLVPIAVGETVRLNNIFFDHDSAVLGADSFPELDRVIVLLNENPGIRIQISGHTDNTGDAAYNLKLSEYRARAILDYLILKKIAASRLSARGYGESKPARPNDSEENRKFNRRVEFKITGK